MIVNQIPVGKMRNFCYVVSDQTGECIVIDPSWDLERVETILQESSLRVKYIVNTHHHFDHTLGNEQLANTTGARIVQHELSELSHNISVSDGQAITFGASSLAVMHTPGHSKDSICLMGDGKLFTGDTLFVGNCGRVDLPGGSAKELYHSIFDVLYGLDDSLVLYCGHDYGTEPVSTLGQQKKTNPVMQRRSEAEFVEMMGQ